MAKPILQKTGSVSGTGPIGEGTNDLVIGEDVTVQDTEAANVGASRLSELLDTPIGSAASVSNPNSDMPSFSPDKTGSYKFRMTVDGVDSTVEIFAVPLPETGSRIPAFEEEKEYDGSGNSLGWHQAVTDFMRKTDASLGEAKTSTTSRQGSVAVPTGGSTQEIELGAVIYPGSLLALGAQTEEAVAGGTIDINVKINGVTQFSVQLSTSNPSHNFSTQTAGDHPISQGDVVTIEIVGANVTSGSGGAIPVAIAVVLSNSLTTGVLTVPDASNTQKGVTKLSVPPAISTEPVAAGTNDSRIPLQDENDALAGTAGNPSSANPYVTEQDPRNTDSRDPNPHDLAGAEHNADTLANLNAKVSDATLDDASDPRDPNAHALGGAAHNADTLANLNTKVSDATLDDAGDPRDPTAHAASHEFFAADEIDGDKLGIDAVTPSNYNPVTTVDYSNSSHLGAHLHGIDNAFATNVKHGQKTLQLSAFLGLADAGVSSFDYTNDDLNWQAVTSGDILIIPVPLNVGDRILEVRTYVEVTGGAEISSSFLFKNVDDSTSAGGSTEVSTTTNSFQTITHASLNHTISSKTFVLMRILPGAGGDVVFGVAVDYDHP